MSTNPEEISSVIKEQTVSYTHLDVYKRQDGTQVQNPLRQQCNPDQYGQYSGAFTGAEQKQKSAYSGEYGKSHDQPPLFYSKRLGFQCNLNLKQRIGQNQNAHRYTDKIHQTSRMY